MDQKRILFVGLGDLGAQIFDLLVRLPGQHIFLVGGRNDQYLGERTNLSLFAASQLGFSPHVSCTYLDLRNVDQTAQVIENFRPDIIFCAATLLRWGAISRLPKPVADRLYAAQMGPWLPIHLTLVYRLMQAVKQTGLAIKVVNASYPDVVNPVLNKVGLAPLTGIGYIANNIPALRMSIAFKLGVPLEQVEVRFFAQRYVNHRISRVGNAGGAPFHLTVFVDGQDQTDRLDMLTIFDLLPTTFKRAPGQLMTAASAMAFMESLVGNEGKITHAPGPNGLPGGYPVSVCEDSIEALLPEELTIQEAIHLNEVGMKFDGIDHIDEQGTVYFTGKEMAILKDMFGYECKSMPLIECEYWAEELMAKYTAFEKTFRK